MTKKEPNLSGTLSEAVSVATSVAYTRQEIQKLKTELVSLLEKKTTELIVEQVPGPVGPRGALGATGAQGPKGDKGDKGDVGERGEKGEVGPQGNMGLDGPRGLKGDKGDKGEQGQVGPQGEQGIQGLAGERGPQGLKGDRGEDGKNGLDGKDGQAGAIGPVGPAGSQGVQGGQGPKGDKGERGRDGQQGVAGPAGPQGEIGPQGIQGVAGKDGKDGDIKPVEEKFQKFIDNVQRDVNSFKTKVNAAILKSGPNDAWKATGSGEVNLRYLDDVDRDSITDGYVLSYDSANAKFKFVEQGGGDGTDQWARNQANAAYDYANTLALESGTLDTTARTTANSAWYTANLAYVTANSAWATANSALNQQSGDIDPFARSQANSAFNQANISYTVANNSWSTANASYIQANSALSIAQSAFAQANTGGAAGTDNLARSIANSAFSTANLAYTQANTSSTLAQAAYDAANTKSTFSGSYADLSNKPDLTVYLTSANLTPYATTATTNTIATNVASAWSTANSATTLAQSAYDFANTIVSDTQIDPFARSQANSGFNQANTANSIAVSAFAQANAGVAQASSALIRAIDANTLATNAFTRANTAYAQANTATTLAQSAYDYANTIVVPSLSGYATNTTVNLVWSTANNAYAQANTGLAKDYTLNTVTSNTSIANTDSRELFLCDTSNNVVLTMPAGNTVGDGFNFKVTRLGSGEVTLAGAYNNNVIRGIKFGDINFNFNTVYDEPLSAYENVLLDGEYKTSQLALSSFDNQTSFELVSINDTEYALVQGTVLPSGTQDFAIEDYNDLINTPDLSVYATTTTTTTIATNVSSAWSTANLAYTQANSALSIAQSAFAQANTGGADNVARSIANSAFSTANSAFAKANTGTSQLVNGASTVSLSANGNLTVAGPIIGLGNSKLDFTTYGANTAYLTTTSDDSTALYMGLASAELYADTTVQIRTNTAGVSKNWTFGADGSTTLPGTVDITYTPDTATGSAITINGANTQGGTGYADFLKVTNTSGGATNPNKSFRLTSTGTLEIINSAYDANLFSLTNAGGLSVSGPISVGGKQAVNGPAFRAYVATGQAITSGSQQKVTFGTENFDTNGNFASSRFTPTIEGYYQLNATVRIDGTSSTGEVMIILYKNGSEYARGHNQSGTEQGASFYSMSVSDIAYANGTSDYFEVYIQQSSGGNRNTTAGSPISYFSGVMVRGA